VRSTLASLTHSPPLPRQDGGNGKQVGTAKGGNRGPRGDVLGAIVMNSPLARLGRKGSLSHDVSPGPTEDGLRAAGMRVPGSHRSLTPMSSNTERRLPASGACRRTTSRRPHSRRTSRARRNGRLGCRNERLRVTNSAVLSRSARERGCDAAIVCLPYRTEHGPSMPTGDCSLTTKFAPATEMHSRGRS
jgi:hypothetical protein